MTNLLDDPEPQAAVPLLRSDEPAPLGGGTGPSPVQLLAAAVGNCLSDSLLFALRKFKQKPDPIQCEVTCEVGRNAQGRLRVLGLEARLTLGVPAEAIDHQPVGAHGPLRHARPSPTAAQRCSRSTPTTASAASC